MKKPALLSAQVQGIKYGLAHPYSILALDPGLGKSRTAIEIRERKGKNTNCLIVCPGYLALNWVDEIKLWAPPDRSITVIQKGQDIYDLFDTDYAIISYELAQKAENFFEWADMLVIDEAHYLKTMEAKRTEYIHKQIFENSLKSVLLLTGTPIKNRVPEFYSLLCICNYDPNTPDSPFLEQFPTSIDFADKFSNRHEFLLEVKGGRRIKILKWTGLRNKDELKQHLKGHYLRIKSEDVLDLPPVTFKDVNISNLPDRALKEAFESYFNGEDTGGVNPTAKAQAALKKTPITIKYAVDLLEEVDSLLIYSDHIEASEAIAQAFGVKALNSNIQSRKRMEAAKKFQSGEGRVLVATIGGLSVGVNLTRSHHLIFNDYAWVPGDIKQTIYRIQRTGQKHRCTVHRMIGSPQDRQIMNTLTEKMNVIERIT